MFKTRLISGIVLIILLVTVIYLGKLSLLLALFVLSLTALFELYRALKLEKTMMAAAVYLFTVAYYLLFLFEKQNYAIYLTVFLLPLLLMIYVFSFPKYTAEKPAYIFMGFFYVTVMFSYIYNVRLLDNGSILIWLVFIGSWGSDTCAYVTGITLGKHKAFPVLSPKKSIEGCIGGIIGAGIIGAIFALCLKGQLSIFTNPVLACALTGACSSILSQLGDLAASAIKRNYAIKDYGRLIPGHGGIMDRFDSVIFTAPVVYYLLLVLA